MPGLRVKIAITTLQECVGVRIWLWVGAMIDEFHDRYARRKLGESANVIAVIVSRDEVVDLRQPGILCCSSNALGITNGGGPAVSRIDENRFAGRGYKQD